MATYWIECYPDGEIFLWEEPAHKVVGYNATGRSTLKIIDVLQDFGKKANSVAFADSGKAKPKMEPAAPDAPKNKKVLIDPGHSDRYPGAVGKTSKVKEEVLNRFQAECLQKELAARGVKADIYDPPNDDLSDIGRHAQGYDAFVSLHLNAYANKEYYTCAMCHPSVQSPLSKSAKVASEWAQAIATSNGEACFSGSPGWPKGVMAVGLGVLRGASQTNCPIFFLSEAEFVDDESDDVAIKVRLTKALAAGADVLVKYL